MPDYVILKDGTVASRQFAQIVGDDTIRRYAEIAMRTGRTVHEVIELVELGQATRREEAATKKQ